MVDDRDRVTGPLNLVQEVRRRHDCPSIVDQALDHRLHLVPSGWVNPVHRLVQDQKLRIAEQTGRQLETLAHANRVRADLVVGPVGQIHPRHGIARDDERAARDQRRIGNRLRADLLAVFPAAIDIADGDPGAPCSLGCWNAGPRPKLRHPDGRRGPADDRYLQLVSAASL
jgi:hypothetical protein